MSFNTNTKAMCLKEKDGKFQELEFQRRPVGDLDVGIDVLYCGICHSDIHTGDNDFGSTKYPCVPGHELAGVVRQVGSKVTKFKVGDHVGIGCFVDSCLDCFSCKNGDEQYCVKGMTGTYNSKPQHGRSGDVDYDYTLGGYANKHVVDERFVVNIPKQYPLEKAGPLLCAGITLYDPLKHWGATNGGLKVGIAGLGGLGLMGVKLAKQMGNEVTVISSSPSKEQVAREIGADHFVIINDPASVKKQLGQLDLILNTVSATHELSQYLPLLNTDGTIVQFGLSIIPHSVAQFQLLMARISVAGSMIGGIKNAQECVDFCHKHNIFCETKLITINDIDDVWTNLKTKNDQVIRYVIDLDTFNSKYNYDSKCKAIVFDEPKSQHRVIDYQRKQLGDFDVGFSVDYCGVCHSDLHTADNDWYGTQYPTCPGHELSGTVEAVGRKVTKFKVGDKVGVGCFVDACLECDKCKAGDEQYCRKGMTGTYNGVPTHGRAGKVSEIPYTFGGYTTRNVVDERFVIKVPDNYPIESAGVILCAGITLYDPLKHWGALKGGLKVGIAGFGGLGLMGVKQAIAMGNQVTVLSTSPQKEEAAKKMGAQFVLISNQEQLTQHARSLDLILDTISVPHDAQVYLNLLNKSGKLIMLGGVVEPFKLNTLSLLVNRHTVAGSLIGGIRNQQECIDFCAKHKILPEISVLPATDINKVYDILRGKNDQAIRYVLNIKDHLK